MSLDGQVALVTGGGRGIGRAISLALARSAAKVVVNYRQNSATADETVKLIKHDGGEAVAVQADVASSDQVKSLVRSCLDEFGQVDILVNNATPELKSKLLMNTDYSDINEYFDVYVKGTLELVQQVVPDMQQRRYGRIISSLTSALTEVPPRLGSYVIAKSALYGLCRTLSVELAPFNITVNMVSPSVVLSDLTAQIGATATEAARRKIPLGRMAQPSEVAEAVLFLASPQSSFITGANLPVTGGVLS